MRKPLLSTPFQWPSKGITDPKLHSCFHSERKLAVLRGTCNDNPTSRNPSSTRAGTQDERFLEGRRRHIVEEYEKLEGLGREGFRVRDGVARIFRGPST